jgi:hypothetical protein
VSALNSRSHRKGRPPGSPDQPDNKRDNGAQKDERQAKNEKQPQGAAASKRRNIASDGGLGIAMETPAKDGHGLYLGAAVQPHISGEGCCIASDLGVALKYDASAKCRNVTVDATPNPDAATKTGYLGNLLVASNADVMAKLSAVVRALGYGGSCKHGNKRKANQP